MTRRRPFRVRRWIALVGAYLLSALAFLWRRLMVRTTFIAISGSVGKSTATACLGTILSAHYPTNWDRTGRNHRALLARIVLRTRPWHRFAVIEVGTRAPGALRRAAWTIAPDVVLMLRVLSVHSNAFPTLAEVAAEKTQLLSRLGRRGLAVLNADDERVLAMRERCRGRVRTFGIAPASDVTAADVSARWPQPLRFRVRAGAEWLRAPTQLVGGHLLYSALGALATAVSCGVPLEKAVAALGRVRPVPGRMQPVPLPSGATAIRDTYNGALPALQAGLDFLVEAEAARRIVVVGDVLDSGLTERHRRREIGRRVAAAADLGVFLGPTASLAAKAAVQAGAHPESARAFTALADAAAFLRSELGPGDLVLVRGWEGRHLERVVIEQTGAIGCRLQRCEKRIQCDECPDLHLVPFPRAETDRAPAAIHEETPSWYLDALVAAQKRDVHQRWIRRSVGDRRRRVVLKTDLFEEAYGDDLILEDLFADTRLAIGNEIDRRTALAAARRGRAAFRPVIGDVRHLPLESGCVDVVISNSTLDHFESKRELARSLRELARVLRPSGVLLVTLDNPLNPLYHALRWGSRRGWAPFALGATVSPATLRRMLTAVGLRIERTEYLIHNPRGVSTLLFLALRKLLRARADAPIRAILRAFALLERLPSRSLTGCFVAVSARKPAADS